MGRRVKVPRVYENDRGVVVARDEHRQLLPREGLLDGAYLSLFCLLLNGKKTRGGARVTERNRLCRAAVLLLQLVRTRNSRYNLVQGHRTAPTLGVEEYSSGKKQRRHVAVTVAHRRDAGGLIAYSVVQLPPLILTLRDWSSVFATAERENTGSLRMDSLTGNSKGQKTTQPTTNIQPHHRSGHITGRSPHLAPPSPLARNAISSDLNKNRYSTSSTTGEGDGLLRPSTIPPLQCSHLEERLHPKGIAVEVCAVEVYRRVRLRHTRRSRAVRESAAQKAATTGR